MNLSSLAFIRERPMLVSWGNTERLQVNLFRQRTAL